MQVFVTGATGFIGLSVASALAQRGHRVLGLARTSEKARVLARREIEPVLGGLQEPGAWRERAAECAAFVHCAFEYSPKGFELDRNVLRVASELGGRKGAARKVVYTSGVWVYGDTGTRCVDETTAPNPPKFVAARVENENFLLSCARPELATIVVRPGCVYGGHGSLTAGWFDGATKGAARIVGDGANRWAMVHVEDLARLYVLAAESPLGGEVLNATDRSRFTVRECAIAASRAAGAGGAVVETPYADALARYGPLAQGLAASQHIDSSKAVRLLGWQPRHGGFVDGARRYFRSWKAGAGA